MTKNLHAIIKAVGIAVYTECLGWYYLVVLG